MFTKEEIKANWFAEREAALAAGKPAPKAGVNLALLILSSALFHQKDWGGKDYGPHPIHVGFNNTRSTIKQIVGILHDVVEDSDWTIDDLRDLGFHERICIAVDGMTLRRDQGEKYAEFIVRCGTSGRDAIDKKIEDLEHNSINTRTPHIFEDDQARLKRSMYNIAFYYLVAIKQKEIEPGSPLMDFIKSRPEYNAYPGLVNQVLERFSSLPDRLPLPPVRLGPDFTAGTGPAQTQLAL